jgi:hypothetical protein
MATAISATLAPVTYVPAAQASQVTLLYQQGVSPAEIAAILDLSAAAVDGYLGITPAGVVLLPTLAATPTSGGSAFPSISTVG